MEAVITRQCDRVEIVVPQKQGQKQTTSPKRARPS